jgi:hypothetical protein
MQKTTFVLILLISVPAMLLNAQGRRERSAETQEKFKSMKVAYFTEELEFTSQEAEKFWPVYNEHEKNKSELYRERRKLLQSFTTDIETISDEKAEDMLEQHLDFQKKDLQLDTEFYAKIKEVLPPKKIMKLHITEVGFREYMLKRLRGQRNGQDNNRENKDP